MLDQLKPDVIVRSPVFPEPVKIILAVPVGNQLKLIAAGVQSGRAYQPILSTSELATLQVSPQIQPYDGDAVRFRLGIEAMRLGLAYEYDPYFALSIARIDPLPHQLEAVYDYFLKSPQIRFLLADDPGAGKTIMAGLLIQELKARGLVKRILIVAPANLTFQWQRELKDKFRQQFNILNSAVLRTNYGRNPWQEHDQILTSISWVSRVEDARASLLRSRWDLVIVDEAHKMSAANADSKTLAYDLGEELSERTDHYLLMTATPHKGDPRSFALFLRLLDADVYGDVESLHAAIARQSAPFYLRRVKEALVTFPHPDTGEVKKLFTRREVRTIEFKINHEEWDFYDALTRYVEEQSVLAAQEATARGRAIGFTMAMLQRRFASSIYAARRTLERMKARRERILADPEKFRAEQIARRIPDDFDELPEEEQQEILEELESSVLSFDPNTLHAEIEALTRLIEQAHKLENSEAESKLLKLKETITREGIFDDPKMKLLIFTEHKDTLDYLAGDGREGRPLGKLREWGLTVTQIHGGMKIGDRDTPGTRIYAESEFRDESCRVMVATEAAGEGINLQFCWFMINYDIPWNPVRLEQRMGRIHRYGQERDCLIINFVATNTAEGRVLAKLFERVRAIESDLDPHAVGTVFNVLGDIFPANQLERMVREMYARNLTEEVIKDRIVQEVNLDHFRQITHSALEGLAKRELNLAVIVGKQAEAKERRLVPEVIEDFFLKAGPVVGVLPRTFERQNGVFRIDRLPRLILHRGEQLESRFGRLGQEYRRFTFAKEQLQQDPALEWVTPGHPLFEAIRAEIWEQVQTDLERGALFYDLHRQAPACLDVFTAAIQDGRGRTLHERLFIVETAGDGTMTVRQPTLLLDLIPAPPNALLPTDLQPPAAHATERALLEQKLTSFLDEVRAERLKEIEVVSRHVEVSLNALLDRQNLRVAELEIRRQAGDADPLLPANLKQAVDRLDELAARLERRQSELEQERYITISDIRRRGRCWVLPHPERTALNIAPMVRDDEIERMAMKAVIRFETARGWQVENVASENKGFDLISRRLKPDQPDIAVEVRYIEVKGRAHVGPVALSGHEYSTAYRLKHDYWLYAVFNCATDPNPYPFCVCDPVRLRWEPMQEVIQYRVDAQSIMDEAAASEGTPPTAVAQAFREAWQSRLSDVGEFNILVEGLSDKLYLELAAQRYREQHNVDLLEGGRVRIIAGRGTKRIAPDFGLLQALEQQGIRFVAILDGDDSGRMAAEAMSRFGAQRNRHFFQLERPDYKDKGGKSWDVEIEDMLPWPLLESYIQQYPQAVEEHNQRSGVHKVVIQGKPVEVNGQKLDYKLMLTEFVRQRATMDELHALIGLLKRARSCMGLQKV
ncbi:MAG: helicase [Chloroflexi bacterium]|nr:MAG: helicase [Chloroflexota bacterium]